jgi:hypothetical protein
VGQLYITPFTRYIHNTFYVHCTMYTYSIGVKRSDVSEPYLDVNLH